MCRTSYGVWKSIVSSTSWRENCKATHLFLTNWHEGRFHSVKIQAIVIPVFKQTFSIRWLNTRPLYLITHIIHFQSWHPNRWFQFRRTENVLMSVVGKQAIIVHVKNDILSFNKYRLLQKKNIYVVFRITIFDDARCSVPCSDKVDIKRSLTNLSTLSTNSRHAGVFFPLRSTTQIVTIGSS